MVRIVIVPSEPDYIVSTGDFIAEWMEEENLDVCFVGW